MVLDNYRCLCSPAANPPVRLALGDGFVVGNVKKTSTAGVHRPVAHGPCVPRWAVREYPRSRALNHTQQTERPECGSPSNAGESLESEAIDPPIKAVTSPSEKITSTDFENQSHRLPEPCF